MYLRKFCTRVQEQKERINKEGYHKPLETLELTTICNEFADIHSSVELSRFSTEYMSTVLYIAKKVILYFLSLYVTSYSK